MKDRGRLHTDKEFIQGIQAGNKQLYEKFVKVYYEKFYQFTFQYLKNKEDAEELVQDFLIDIWIKREQLDIKNLEAYCWISIRNKSLNKLSKKRLHLEELSDNNSNSYVQDESKELYEIIQKGITQLPNKTKEVFLLCREKGLSYQEVADALNIGRETVKSHMKTALSKLRVFIKEHGFGIVSHYFWLCFYLL